MSDCPYHDGLMKDIASAAGDARVSLERTVRLQVETDDLFCKHSNVSTIIRQLNDDISPKLALILERQKTMGEDLQEHREGMQVALSGICAEIKTHYEAFTVLKAEVDAFGWFRKQMNWLKDKLPWWVMGIILIAFLSLFGSVEMISRIKKLVIG